MVAENMTLGVEHSWLAGYLIGSGVISGLNNLLGLMAFWWYPHLLCTPSAIPEIALLLSDLCVACLHPFSGFSAMKNEWVWGPYGCQLYSFFGFLFGNFQCLCVPFVAFDRYLESGAPPLLKKLRTKKTYMRIFIFLFIQTFFWAVTPLPFIGWASYAVTPVGVTCTIDWMRTDASYVSYITALCLIVFFLPLAAAIVFYMYVYYGLKSDRVTNLIWAKKGWEGTVMLGCCLTTYLAFSGYSVLVLWPFFVSPSTIPKGLHILPAPMGKMAGLINPIFYIWLNPRLCACVRKMLGLSYDHSLVEPIAGEDLVWSHDQLSGRSNDGRRASRLDMSELSPLALANNEARQDIIHND